MFIIIGYENSKIPRLFEIMKEKKIKAKDITSAIGVSSGLISDWKSGKSAPSGSRLVDLANFLNVSVEYLLGKDTAISKDEENEQKNNATDNSDIPSDSLALNISDSELTDILNRLSDKSLSELESYLDYLLWKQDQES